MWFIIIFGSLPTLRPVFLTTVVNLKSITGRNKRTKEQSYPQGENSWVELSGKGFQAQVDGGRKAARTQYGRGDSEEEILGTAGEITITKETTVRTSQM